MTKHFQSHVTIYDLWPRTSPHCSGLFFKSNIDGIESGDPLSSLSAKASGKGKPAPLIRVCIFRKQKNDLDDTSAISCKGLRLHTFLFRFYIWLYITYYKTFVDVLGFCLFFYCVATMHFHPIPPYHFVLKHIPRARSWDLPIWQPGLIFAVHRLLYERARHLCSFSTRHSDTFFFLLAKMAARLFSPLPPSSNNPLNEPRSPSYTAHTLPLI